jgi:hypothetical protein
MAEIEAPKDRDDELRARHDAVRLLAIPTHRFAMIDGSGPPGDGSFAPRLPGLYAIAYGLRFALKHRGIEGRVGPLEGLWWRDDGATDLDTIFSGDQAPGRWTLMIALPEAATAEEIDEQLVRSRAKLDASVAGSLRVEAFEEGPVAQILHVGPYAAERPTIERLHEAVGSLGYRLRGRHHELYLGDPRRSAPERLRTILRHPIERAPALVEGGLGSA